MLHGPRDALAAAVLRRVPFSTAACGRVVGRQDFARSLEGVECPDCQEAIGAQESPENGEVSGGQGSPPGASALATRPGEVVSLLPPLRPKSPAPAEPPLKEGTPALVARPSSEPVSSPVNPKSIVQAPSNGAYSGGFDAQMLLGLFSRLQVLEGLPEVSGDGWARWMEPVESVEDGDPRGLIGTEDRFLLREVAAMFVALSVPRVGRRLLALVDALVFQVQASSAGEGTGGESTGGEGDGVPSDSSLEIVPSTPSGVAVVPEVLAPASPVVPVITSAVMRTRVSRRR